MLEYAHKLADWLQVMEVPIYNRTHCEQDYGMIIDDGMFCAGYDSGLMDACHGDSGGPGTGYDENESKPRLLGIVSWGIRCAFPFKPGVYVKVSHFISWINETIENNTYLILN